MKVSKPGEPQGTNLLHDGLLQQRGGEEQGSQKQAAQIRRSSNKRNTVACRHAGLDAGRVAVSAVVPDKRDKDYKSKDDITSLMINGKQSFTHQGWDESSGREDAMSTELPTATVVHAASLFIFTQSTYISCFIWITEVQDRADSPLQTMQSPQCGLPRVLQPKVPTLPAQRQQLHPIHKHGPIQLHIGTV